MSDIIVWLAWIGAIAWPALLGFALWRGLKRGRGPGMIGWSLIGVVSLAWFLGMWAVMWEPQQLMIRRVEATSAAWSGAPLRIGVISDTHTDGPQVGVARLNRIIDAMNAEQPDIVVLLGDFVDGHKLLAERGEGEQREIAEGLAAFSRLKAPLGVHAVLGNHDWWYDGPTVEAQLKLAAVNVMENDRVRISREGGAFWIGGLADYDSERTQPSYGVTLGPQVDEEPAVPMDEPVIVMSHWPDAFAVAPDRVALTLAGHSHCGQVNLPFLGRPVAVSEGSRRWPCGLYEERGRRLYVSGGVGVSVMPVRFGQPPEIAVVTLRAQ
jgi:predicted MPP superfamily phosphohydrolase